MFSGIQPTGELTLGNYLGSIRNWCILQNDPSFSQIYFSIVDHHSLSQKFIQGNSF